MMALESCNIQMVRFGHHTAAGPAFLINFLDSVQVGRWIKTEFGVRSVVTAVFFTHAIINNNNSVSAH
jgi:hypothetical protein